MDWQQILAMFGGGAGAGADAGLAGAMQPAPQMAPVMSAINPGAQMSLAPAMAGQAPGFDPNASIQGGMSSMPPGGPVQLATPANINKLAMAPIDPAKVMALLQGEQGQNRGMQAPGSSPAAGHGVGQLTQVNTAAVKRPGALGGR